MTPFFTDPIFYGMSLATNDTNEHEFYKKLSHHEGHEDKNIMDKKKSIIKKVIVTGSKGFVGRNRDIGDIGDIGDGDIGDVHK